MNSQGIVRAYKRNTKMIPRLGQYRGTTMLGNTGSLLQSLGQHRGKTMLKEWGSTRGILRGMLGEYQGNTREILRI